MSGAKGATVKSAIAVEEVAGAESSEAGPEDDEEDDGEENMDGLQGFEDVLVRNKNCL